MATSLIAFRLGNKIHAGARGLGWQNSLETRLAKAGGVSTGTGPAVSQHISLLSSMVTRSSAFQGEIVPICEVRMILSGVQGSARDQVCIWTLMPGLPSGLQ